MRVCQIYVGHRRTFWWSEKNHKDSLFPIHYVHHRDENSSSFNYHRFETHPYEIKKDTNTVVRNVLNMWHNRYLAFSSAPEGYDLYVLMRYDIEISSPIDFREFSYDDDTIYIPSDNDHGWGVNDHMVFGTWEVIKKYVSINTNHLNIFNSNDENLYPWFHPESYTTKNLLDQGVKIERIRQRTRIVYDKINFPSDLLDDERYLSV